MKEEQNLENLKRFKKWFDGKGAALIIIIIIINLAVVTSFFICRIIYEYLLE